MRGLRSCWACTFHVVCFDFVRVGYPRFLVEHGLEKSTFTTSGWPEPDLKWYKLSKNGEMSHIQNTDKHKINILLNHANILDQQERWFQLIVKTLEANDFGTYICEGNNKLGSSQAKVKLFGEFVVNF